MISKKRIEGAIKDACNAHPLMLRSSKSVLSFKKEIAELTMQSLSSLSGDWRKALKLALRAQLDFDREYTNSILKRIQGGNNVSNKR